MEPRIQYAKTKDGVSIAYSVVGSGPPLVRVTHGLWNHVEAWWRIAPYRKMAERLAETHTFINYDARGTGLSQRGTEDFRLEPRLLDLEAVLAALDIGRCAMVGTASCLAAFAYAVQHPERVSKLALVNPYARSVDYRQLPQIRARESQRAMLEEIWEQYRMDLATGMVDYSDAELARQVADVMAEAMTPATLRLLQQQTTDQDISDLLPRVKIPTLVIVARNHPSAELSREVAALIPGARVTTVDGRTFAWLPDNAVDALEAFLGEEREGKTAPEQPSGTAIILFADIADSTALTERLGDAAFRDKARELDEALRRAVTSNGGTAIDGKLLGDGVLATFGAAREAIACAGAVHAAGSHAGLPLHIGIHAGDVIREDNNVYGGAVNIASRVADEAAAGETLVSATVRDLARTSAGVSFEERGKRDLKGVGEPVRVFAVREEG